MSTGEHADMVIVASQPNTLTSADVARMANVRPSAVSNWRNRANKHFPSPVDSKDGRPLFDYDQVAAWLKGNGIEFKDNRTEQAVWSFFDRWRDQKDPVLMTSVLLWALSLGKCAREAGLSDAWKALTADVPDVTDDLAERCRALVETVLHETEGRHDSSLGLALDPHDSATLNPASLVEVLRFADDMLSLGNAEASQLASMVLTRSIAGNGRMYDESGHPDAPASVLLAKLAAAHVENMGADSLGAVSVYDPACGILEGSIQLASMLHTTYADMSVALHCADINPNTVTLTARRFALAGISSATLHLRQQDTLKQDAFPELRADLAMVEPPFVVRRDNDATDPRWKYGVPPKWDSTLAWIEDAVAHLSSTGRAFVVTAEGPLFRSQFAERSIRRALVAAGCVEAVISLPGSLYSGTAIPTAVWVLSAPDSDRESVAMISTAVNPDEYASEDETPSWMRDVLDRFSHDRTLTRMVRSIDILSTDSASLLPDDWLERLAPDSDSIAESYQVNRGRLAALHQDVDDALHTIDDFDACGFACSEVGIVPLSDIATIRRGRVTSADSRQSSQVSQALVTVEQVRNHAFRADMATADDGSATKPGDILFTATGDVCAMVDADGGHLATVGVHIARLRNDLWNPEYVALMIEGEWNRRSMGGRGLRSIRPSDLEIPALPVEQQNRLAAYVHAVGMLRRQVSLYGEQLGVLANAVRYNATVGTVKEDSMENGE